VASDSLYQDALGHEFVLVGPKLAASGVLNGCGSPLKSCLTLRNGYWTACSVLAYRVHNFLEFAGHLMEVEEPEFERDYTELCSVMLFRGLAAAFRHHRCV
jgi:hypothetical protein